MNYRARRWTPIVIAVAVVFYAAVYQWGMHSNAYRYVNAVVRRSPEIHSRVGNVRSVRLALLGGYSENYTDERARATVTLVVDGERGEATVKARVEEKDGDWAILGAWVNGRKTKLN